MHSCLLQGLPRACPGLPGILSGHPCLPGLPVWALSSFLPVQPARFAEAQKEITDGIKVAGLRGLDLPTQQSVLHAGLWGLLSVWAIPSLNNFSTAAPETPKAPLLSFPLVFPRSTNLGPGQA